MTDSDPLQDPRYFDLDLLARAQKSGRHLFGHVADEICSLSVSLASQPQAPGIWGRIFAPGKPKLPLQDDLVQWIEGNHDLPPDLPNRRGLYKSHDRSKEINVVINTAFHPDAPWDSQAARRLGKYLTFSSTHSVNALTDPSPQDAMLEILARSRQVYSAPFLGMTFDRAVEINGGDTFAALLAILENPMGPKQLPGFSEAFLQNLKPLTAQKFEANWAHKVLIYASSADLLGSFAHLYVQMAASRRASDRQEVVHFLKDVPLDALKQASEALADEIGPPGRTLLYETLAARRAEDAAQLFRRWLETETAAKPKKVMEDTLARLALSTADQPDDELGYTAADGSRVSLPELPPIEPFPEFDEAVLEHLRDAIAAYNEAVDRSNEAAIERAKQSSASLGKPVEPSLTQHMSEKHIRATAAEILDVEPETPRVYSAHTKLKSELDRHYTRLSFDGSALIQFLDDPRLHWRHLLRLSERTDLKRNTADDKYTISGALWRRINSGVNIREVVREKPEVLPHRGSWWHPLEDYDCEDLWQVLVPSLGEVIHKLSISTMAKNGMQELSILPRLPMRAIPDLTRIALSPGRSLRLMAQKLLAGVEQVTPMIVDALSDSKADIRATAALWLGQRGDQAVVPAIEARLKKERVEGARAALLTALRKLGGDMAPWLDAKALQKEAEKALPKLKMDKIMWLLPALPTDLRWADGTPLSREILHYWCGLAFRLKQPGGNGLFALWLDELEPESAARLGVAVITAWIARDVEPRGEESARNLVMTELLLEIRASRSQGWTYLLPSKVLEGAEADAIEFMVQHHMNDLTGATDCKGILGLGVRANGAEVAATARAYLKKHGERVSQAKSIVECMAGNPAPATIQVVIGVSERFRQKSVQKLAQDLVAKIAEDRGWSADELADRTIPTGGFIDGGIELDMGRDRIFTAHLAPDSSIVLRNPEGKPVKALPAPSGTDDDIAQGKACKKQLSAAKKEAKQVTEQLSLRLFEAMCLERHWPVGDWMQNLQKHPIAGLLCQRLVWRGLSADGASHVTFRPLEDGSLTDHTDGDVSLEKMTEIRLVHGGLFRFDERQSWKDHLADYEVRPLFDQFLDPVPIREQDTKRTEIEDRRGWIIETFSLRGQAQKLGYERGPILDGGGFNSYVKMFRNAGLAIEIGFSGSHVPEKNFKVALLDASVQRLRGDRFGPALSFDQIPLPLLTAVRSDLAKIADAGSGFADDFKDYGW